MEKDIIDTLVPPDGDTGQVGTIIQAMEIVDARRKKLFPNLRRFVLDYDLRVSEGRVALNVISESMSADISIAGILAALFLPATVYTHS